MIARPAADMPRALQHLQRAVAFDCLGNGTGTVAELAAGEAVFELVADGRVVGAFTLGVQQYSDGRVIRCGAAGGEGGHDLLSAMVDFAEGEARGRVGARALVCETSRRGLVRRLERRGFRVAGFILRKDM